MSPTDDTPIAHINAPMDTQDEWDYTPTEFEKKLAESQFFVVEGLFGDIRIGKATDYPRRTPAQMQERIDELATEFA